MARPAVDRFSVLGGGGDISDAAHVAFVDGSADDGFRAGEDIELSHWVPNRTPGRWKADSSTEICLRFAEDPPPERYEVAVNNHLDVDGILSVFSLVHSPIALEHRSVVVGAAELGDFSTGTGRRSFRLAQELTLLMGCAHEEGWEAHRTYAAAFDLVPSVLANNHEEPASIVAGWELLQRSHEQMATDVIHVEPLGPHLVSFVLPRLEDDEIGRALRVPPFNSFVDESVWLWPHARNLAHGESIHLVSLPTAGGHFHDLWLPGYAWADTPNRWKVPGLRTAGTSNEWIVDDPALAAALDELQRSERNPGRWTAASRLTPFHSMPGRGFPVVASFVGADGSPVVSSLSAAAVANVLGAALARVSV